MPCDVATRWNSTNDMLEFTLEHQPALTKISGDLNYGLRQFELLQDEWRIAEQFCTVLKVHDK
jgi:hypothetical protein